MTSKDTSGAVPPSTAQAFEAIGIPVAVLVEDGTIVATNASWRAEVGERGAIGSRYLDSLRETRVHDADLVVFLEQGIGRVLAGRSARFELEHPLVGPVGERWRLLVVTRAEGGAVVLHVDVTAHHDVRELLDATAHRDPLTGLPNRLAITERLTYAIERGRRQGTDVAVVFLDLDGFKAVNDSLGHGVGDEVLAAVGRRLAGTIRAEDALGRWGGDEFVVVVEGGEAAVRLLASRLHATLELPMAVPGQQPVAVTVSIGAAAVRRGDRPEDVLARADLAMFEAKRGGGSVVLAGSGPAEDER
ncbi:MAG: GGDEF domain-containing protein [Acidimicrobiales bacterium]